MDLQLVDAHLQTMIVHFVFVAEVVFVAVLVLVAVVVVSVVVVVAVVAFVVSASVLFCVFSDSSQSSSLLHFPYPLGFGFARMMIDRMLQHLMLNKILYMTT